VFGGRISSGEAFENSCGICAEDLRADFGGGYFAGDEKAREVIAICGGNVRCRFSFCTVVFGRSDLSDCLGVEALLGRPLETLEVSVWRFCALFATA